MRTILIIEDHIVSCKALTAILENHGYAVVSAHLGEIGLQMAHAYQPDLILCDVLLPDLLGWDVLQQVRGSESIAPTLFVFLTGLEDREYMRKGMILGADDYLLKPVSNQHLIQTLDALFQKQERLAKPFVAEMKRVTQELQNIIYKDYLTGLSNRLGLKEKVQPHLQSLSSQDQNLQFSMIILSVGDWNDLVQVYGQGVMDQLMVRISQRLHHGLQDQEGEFYLAHIDADQLGLFCVDLADRHQITQLLDPFLDYLQQPYTLQDRCFQIQIQVGICCYPDGAIWDPESWFSCARIALQWAKRQVQQSYMFYEQHLGKTTLEWCQLKLDLGQALAREQLELHYQPVFNLTTGQPEQVEALLRWCHPHRGCVMPAKFIPMAEESATIAQLDLWGITMALQQMQTWCQDHHLRPLRMSVNLSAQTLRKPDLIHCIDTILDQTQTPPHLLCLELTERSLFNNLDATQAVLHRLKKRGIQVILDDFGQGYSSLHYLRMLPLDGLKIDQHLIQGLEEHSQNQAILKAIVRMAQGLELRVVAEGVETNPQLDFLRQQGYHAYQGFLACRPLDPEAALDFLLQEQHRRRFAA